MTVAAGDHLGRGVGAALVARGRRRARRIDSSRAAADLRVERSQGGVRARRRARAGSAAGPRRTARRGRRAPRPRDDGRPRRSAGPSRRAAATSNVGPRQQRRAARARPARVPAGRAWTSWAKSRCRVRGVRPGLNPQESRPESPMPPARPRSGTRCRDGVLAGDLAFGASLREGGLDVACHLLLGPAGREQDEAHPASPPHRCRPKRRGWCARRSSRPRGSRRP